MTLQVVRRHEKLAPESGVEFTAPISGAGFWSVCQGPYTLLTNELLQVLRPQREGAEHVHPVYYITFELFRVA